MSDAIESVNIKGLLGEIHYDDFNESPRDWDNLSKMACWHRNYDLGDKEAESELLDAIRGSSAYCESWEDEYSEFYRDLSDPLILLETAVLTNVVAEYLSLYLYDHSGITMSCSPFSCPWDSGQVGFIYLLRTDVYEHWDVKRISPKLKEKLTKNLISDVEIYDQYLTGDVYYICVEDEETGEAFESCGGFYGLEGARKELKSSLDYAIKIRRKRRFEKIKEMIKNKVPLSLRDKLVPTY